MPPLISATELSLLLGTPDLAVLDASWYLPNETKDARALFAQAHIPGARFFDLDEVSDKISALPHMLPSPEIFSASVAALGVSDTSRVVVYDQTGIFSAPRLWWMFRVFGHGNVQVLDGGFGAWRGPVESGEPAPEMGRFSAVFRREMVSGFQDMRANLQSRESLVLDARSGARFYAQVPEPRAGMRAGHIPGAVSLPFTDLLANGFLLPPAELREIFKDHGVDGTREVIASCGSGVTACVLALGLERAGLPGAKIYDGSWAEWGSREDTPIEV